MTVQLPKSGVPLLALLITVLFVAVQSALVWDGGLNGVFNSPDANANYHFAVNFYRTGSLRMPAADFDEPYRSLLSTRSTRVENGYLIPVGFPGMPVFYGLISRVLFINLIPFLTLVFAAIALFVFYLLLADLFDSQTAVIAEGLLAIHPSWWYYTNESMMPNVLFAGVLLIACYLYHLAVRRSSYSLFALAHVACLGALSIRGFEVLWVMPLVLLSPLLLNRTHRVRAYVILFSMYAILGSFGWKLMTYLLGTNRPFGYDIDSSENGFGPWGVLFPDGLHFNSALQIGAAYLIRFLWPYALLMLLGLLVLIRKKTHRRLGSGYALLLVYLIAFFIPVYSSLSVSDTSTPYTPGIALSYARYFLPLFVAGIPAAAFGVRALARNSGKAGFFVMCIIILGISFFTFSVDIVGSQDAFVAKKATLHRYDETATWIRSHTPEDSIIVTPRADKYIWPGRLTIAATDHPLLPEAVRYFSSIRHTSMFYLDAVNADERRDAFVRALTSVDMEIGAPLFDNGDVRLYPITESYDPAT